MYFVYILQSTKDGSHYIGYTSKEVFERLKEHNQGKCKYTKGHRPYELLTYNMVETKREAKSKEKYLKSLKSPQKVIEIVGSPDSTSRD